MPFDRAATELGPIDVARRMCDPCFANSRLCAPASPHRRG